METKSRIEPRTAQNWRSEPCTSQPLLFLAVSDCLWLSALIHNLYSFPIIVPMWDQAFLTNSSFSKRFLWTHRNAFRSMKPQNWNALQHTAKESSHTETTMELARKVKSTYLCQGPSTTPVSPSSHCLRPAVLSPPCGQPLCDPHSPDDFCQERLMPLMRYALIESKQ